VPPDIRTSTLLAEEEKDVELKLLDFAVKKKYTNKQCCANV